MSYSLLYTADGVTKDISDFVSKINFGGDRHTAVRKLDVSLLSGTDVYIPKLDIKNGGLLTVFSDEKELIRAVIFKQDRNNKGEFSVSGYTHGIYLTKNKDTKIFTQVTASQIIRQICTDFNITAGEIADTRIVIPKLVLREKTLWDMILIALTETTNKSQIKYRVFFKEGKLNVCEKRTQIVPLALEADTNLLSAGMSTSIEDTKNKLIVIGKLPQDSGKELTCTIEDKDLQKRYGLMQEIQEDSNDKITDSSLRQTAYKLKEDLFKEMKEANVEALGIDDAEAGMAVYVIEPVTGMADSYYIDQDDHTIEGNSHTMSLKLAFTDEAPALDYEGE